MKRVKLTVVAPSGAEYSQVFPVDDNYVLPMISMDEWVVIEGNDGSAAMVPPQRVVGVYIEAPESPEEHRGGRIN